MKCDPDTTLLSAWIDGDLDSDTSAQIAAHLKECITCAALVADLKAIRSVAQTLALEPVSDAGWKQLAKQLPQLQNKPRNYATIPWAIAAAAVLLAVLSIVIFQGKYRSAEQQAQRELTLLVNQQQRALQALQVVVDRHQAQWDPKLRETFKNNAALVDAAIAECRRAVQKHPTDLALRTSLMEAYQRKVEFLKVFSGLEEAP
jgi:cell division protein FtsB